MAESAINSAGNSIRTPRSDSIGDKNAAYRDPFSRLVPAEYRRVFAPGLVTEYVASPTTKHAQRLNRHMDPQLIEWLKPQHTSQAVLAGNTWRHTVKLTSQWAKSQNLPSELSTKLAALLDHDRHLSQELESRILELIEC